MSSLTKQELRDMINGIQENNPPEAYLNESWYKNLLKQLAEVEL